MMTMYFYVGTQANPVFKCPIGEFYEKISGCYETPEQKTELEIFYHHLRDSDGQFKCKCVLPVNHEFTKLRHFDIDGNIIRKENGQSVVIGVLYPAEEGEEIIPYYATKEAIDPLTKLLNKRGASEYTINKLNSGIDYRQYMIIFDVDNFKSINDTYGHLFGDEVLSKIGSAITRILADRGIASRFGGDEFYIFTKGINDEATLRMFLTALRREIYYAYEGVIENFYVTLSVGVAMYPVDGKTYDELFKKADKCLYIAKEKGKNRYIIYNEEKHGSIDTNEKLKHRALKPSEQAEALAMDMSEMAQTLFDKGIVGIGEVLTTLQNKLEIDGCRVYKNDDPAPVYTFGNSKSTPDMEGILTDPLFLRQFNNNHVLMIAGMPNFEAAYKKYALAGQACDIMACICMYFDREDNNRIFVFFDIYNHTIRWEEYTKNYLLVIGRIISKFI
jgi:diguanylate cyclase (GGDEF)-like protein